MALAQGLLSRVTAVQGAGLRTALLSHLWALPSPRAVRFLRDERKGNSKPRFPPGICAVDEYIAEAGAGCLEAVSLQLKANSI